MGKKSEQIFILGLMLIAMSCLNSCAKTCYNTCPVYPIAGERVAQELENLSTEQAPNFWEWLGRVNKLRQELELCQK